MSFVATRKKMPGAQAPLRSTTAFAPRAAVAVD
jgi:hypothetical protein